MDSKLMLDLAIGLKMAGHEVSCSSEDFSEEAKAKLLKYNLLPEKMGWSPDKVHEGLQAVIIDTQTSIDNSELQRAMTLKVPIHSFPDYIYRLSMDKQRLVVAGGHGKTMITGMILHVLNFHKRKFDYVASAKVMGLENQVRLSDAPIIIIEGQDAMASPLDLTPVFLRYHHHIGVISGIEWQASATYPTWNDYIKQFGLFSAATPKGGVLVYFELDPVLATLSNKDLPDVLLVPYKTHTSTNESGQELLLTSDKERVQLKITGKYNLQNISAAKEALKRIGITSDMFYQAIPSFEGVGN